MKHIARAAPVLLMFLPGVLWAGAGQDAEDGAGEWVVYEDDSARFEHPKSWKASFEEVPPPQTHNKIWRLQPPDRDVRGLGTIRIFGYPEGKSGKEKRPLEKMFRQDDWTNWKAVEKPRHLKLNGAKCIRYRMEGRGGLTFVNPRIETTTVVDCYDRENKFFEIMSAHSLYNEIGKPDELYYENRKIFDRVIGSLEFKGKAEKK